ncbi:hypothetical protein RCH09_000576 [Actimicrobium sp. GrIS 1.19]|uniref:FixH family protein n=1 Tax=Actimicrobium sp. GrIS 1.19 TaxID=3071708 RepID=UPI002E040CDB|nr:hypothetical protein [Actimicrobium sp. GrIS 1.19]
MLKKLYALALPGLLLALSACMTPPQDLDVALRRATAQQRYMVELHPLAEPIRINQMHAWEIRLSTPAGAPITHAQIDIGGGMPQHGHGFPTSPRVTRELGDGRYLLEGMKFSMPGWWEIKLNIHAINGDDKVTFNTVIPVPAPANK